MRALLTTRLDGPAGVELADLPDPVDDTRVAIEVHAAGVSFADLLATQGRYQVKPPLPFAAGLEVAGVVRSAPAGCGVAAGQRVAAHTAFGGFAEVALADAGHVMAIPDDLAFPAASGLIINYQSALFAVQHRAGLRAGERVLVHGAGGGLGLASIEVARALGGHVVAVASSEEKRAAARAAGAEQVLDADDEWPKDFDLIVDPVGGDRFDRSLRHLVPDGRLVSVGFAEGRIPSAAANRLLLRNIGVLGAAWREYVVGHPAYFHEAAATLRGMLRDRAIAPRVGRAYPLARGADALRDLADRRTVGKLVLEVRR